MQIPEFEAELKAIDPHLTIVQNKNRPELSAITYDGNFMVAIPSENIYDERRNNYGVELNGRFMTHRGRIEALGMVKEILKRMEDDSDYRDAMLGVGQYSEAALK